MAGISVSLDGANIQLSFQNDDEGQAVVALQAGALPPFQLRLTDEEARHVVTSLSEILNAPRDVRTSHGGH